MLLTITYNGPNASDLGYLLHKNPSRPQSFKLNYGTAHVFYPEVKDTRATVALLLEMSFADLYRAQRDVHQGKFFEYVTERPFISSSFLSTAISRVFGTAMTGRCDPKPDLALSPLDLEARVIMLPCRSNLIWLNKVFEPLGYSVEYETEQLDEKFPEWGLSSYVNLTIRAQKRLMDLLRHLYVLIPVFDHNKHYWYGKDEIEKLLRLGEGWLEDHPEKQFVVNRYFRRHKAFSHLALDLLDNGQNIALEGDNDIDEAPVKPLSLNSQRLKAVLSALIKSGASSVIDLGCGEGKLLKFFLREKQITRIGAMDVSYDRLKRIFYWQEKLPEIHRKKITVFQGSLTYKDKRINGYDAATIVEVIEHMDKERLSVFEEVVFGECELRTIILTTPNFEYNVNYNLDQEALRHPDHRFEWSRDDFFSWAQKVAHKYDYNFEYLPIGDEDEKCGPPTLMAVFSKSSPNY